MVVNFTLSSEQTALLPPILQLISSQSAQETVVTPDRRRLCSLDSPPSGSRPIYGKVDSLVSASELQFSTDELLSRKQKNKKSTSAQSYLLVSELSLL